MNKFNNGKKQANVKPSRNKQTTVFDLKCHSMEELYKQATECYQGKQSREEDRWDKMLTQTGTKRDKIAAAANLILQHPEKSLKYFDMLVKWCFDNNHNFAIQACQSLSTLYTEHVFADRKALSPFADSVQEFIHGHRKKAEADESQLIGFYLENEMKQFYAELVRAVERLLQEELGHIKKSCIKILGSLARFKQLRRTILGLITNKLGDSDMEVVNAVSKCLKDEFYQDLLASEVLLEESEKFLFRENLAQKSQFYVINFLNNINLKFLNEKSMARIFDIFYHFFSKCVTYEQADELSSRLFLNSIKGLNKIFSTLKGGSKDTKASVEHKIESVYKVVHATPNLKAKIQLLLFLFQSHTYLHGNIPNRFYRLLYEFLANEQILHSSLNELFFDLLLITMKQDENLSRIHAMCKRILQLCFSAQSNFIVTSLLMIDRLIQGNQGYRLFLRQPEKLMSEGSDATEKYDMSKRDPQFSHAEETCLWEVQAFVAHFHPTVRKFASAIVCGTPIAYEGNNPLLEFNLTSFIEKMSLRKEKKSEAWKIKVKRNLSKIRQSKYESLLNKPLDTFKEDEQFIKKYLDTRNTVHTNFKKAQTTDIEEFADGVIEREMDRLNKHNDQDDDEMSFSQQEFDEGSWEEQIMDQGPDSQGNNSEEGEEFDLGEEDGQFKNQEQSGDASFIDEEDMLDGEEEEDEDEFMSQGQQKEFEDAFEEIGEGTDHYAPKNKKIGKKAQGQKREMGRKNNRGPAKKNGKQRWVTGRNAQNNKKRRVNQ